MLVIIDNQCSFIKKFKRSFLAETDLDFVFFDHNQPVVLPPRAKVDGVILSGGRGNPFEPLNLSANFVCLLNFHVPILGFCLGHEIIAISYQGRIKKLTAFQNKKEKIIITKPDDPIFEGLDKTEIMLRKKHSFEVSHIPSSFETLAYSSICKNEIIRHKEKKIYGFQGHPEVSGADGLVILKNFIKMCGLKA